MKFIETIRFENGHYHLLEYHQDRVNRTFSVYFPSVRPIDLSEILPDFKHSGKYKFRVEYYAKAWRIDHSVYTPKSIDSVKIVESDIDYGFKYADRSELNQLVTLSDADEILIAKDGQITDSSYSNLAFFDGSQWFTPKSPLLDGVRRRQLLASGRLSEKDITLNDLQSFQKGCFINAMLDLGELEVPISSSSLYYS